MESWAGKGNLELTWRLNSRLCLIISNPPNQVTPTNLFVFIMTMIKIIGNFLWIFIFMNPWIITLFPWSNFFSIQQLGRIRTSGHACSFIFLGWFLACDYMLYRNCSTIMNTTIYIHVLEFSLYKITII